MSPSRSSRILGAAACISVLALGPCDPDENDPGPPPTSEVKPTDPPSPVASMVNVPITIPIAKLREIANQEVPAGYGAGCYNESVNGGADNGGLSFGYNVARGEIDLSGQGPTITASTPLSYWIKGRTRVGGLVYGSCGGDCDTPSGHGSMRANATLAMTLGVDSLWNVTAARGSVGVRPATPCKITVLNIDVTDKVVSAMEAALGRAGDAFSKQAAATSNLRPRVERLWTELQRPLSAGQNRWLMLGIDQLAVTPLQSDAANVTVGIGARAYPRVVLGAQPTPSGKPLPHAVASAGGDTFVLTIPVDIEYSVLNGQARKALKLDEGGISYPPAGRFQVKPTDVDIYAYGAKVVVRLGFAGSAKGRLYLIGTPQYDAVRHVLSFPDLTYSVETKNLIAKFVDWKEHDNLLRDLGGRLRFDLGTKIEQARTEATTALNRTVGPVTLNGALNSLRLLGVFGDAENQRFTLYVAADGRLSATVQ